MKRNVTSSIGAGSSRCSRRSASARACSRRQALAQAGGARSWRRGSKSIRRGPSRCRTAGIIGPDDRRLGRQRRITSGSSTAPTRSIAVEAAADQNAADRRVLQEGAADLEFDQAGNVLHAWGGTDGQGYDWPDSNHGIYVDTKGIVWIGGNGGDRRPGAEVHAGRQVREAVRQEGREGRQQRAPTTSSRSRRSSSTRRTTRCTSPTATATSASR